MKDSRVRAGLAVLALVSMAACSKAPEPPQSPPELPPTSTQPPISPIMASALGGPYVGKWNGPEGTWLEITQAGTNFEVAVQNLDGVRKFVGMIKSGGQNNEGGLAFTRDGTEFVIRPGSGADTGMKWLADKTNCLIVATGEGYCRE